jgi:hypothetical protein
LLQAVKDAPPDDIWQGAAIAAAAATTDDAPDSQAQFADLPAELSRDKSYPIFLKQLKDHLYREGSLQLWQCAALEAISKPDESEAEFRARLEPQLAQQLATKRDELERQWQKKLADANDRVAKAQSKVSVRRMQFFAKLGSMLWVVFDTIMAAMGKNMPGRRRSLDPALRSMATETGQSSDAKLDLEQALQNQQQVQQQHDEALKQLESSLSAGTLTLDKYELKPQKSDISADEVALVWLPYRINSAGVAEAVFEAAGAAAS